MDADYGSVFLGRERYRASSVTFKVDLKKSFQSSRNTGFKVVSRFRIRKTENMGATAEGIINGLSYL